MITSTIQPKLRQKGYADSVINVYTKRILKEKKVFIVIKTVNGKRIRFLKIKNRGRPLGAIILKPRKKTTALPLMFINAASWPELLTRYNSTSLSGFEFLSRLASKQA